MPGAAVRRAATKRIAVEIVPRPADLSADLSAAVRTDCAGFLRGRDALADIVEAFFSTAISETSALRNARGTVWQSAEPFDGAKEALAMLLR